MTENRAPPEIAPWDGWHIVQQNCVECAMNPTARLARSGASGHIRRMRSPKMMAMAALLAPMLFGAFSGSWDIGAATTAEPAIAAPRIAAPARPNLIVLLTIDQFRADYLNRFGAQMHGGIARLMRQGARFTNAHHDHAITETAPGHASLLSGRFPRSTGIMMNSIGVEDEESPLVDGGYGPGASPRRFIGTTFVDWLNASDRKSQTLSVSMKDRGAILPVGRARADVYWYSIDGRFLTSRYYRKDLPEWVRAFNARQSVAKYAGKTWSLLLPDSAYRERDSVSLEMAGHRYVFPHTLTSDVMDAGSEIRITPFMDDITVDFALAGVNALNLGRGPSTDLLAVSLSATDVIGHNFGPDSREMHDQVLRVDLAVGRLLDSLYAMRDSSTITVVLTSDHGVGPIPELVRDTVKPMAQRVSLRTLAVDLRARLRQSAVDTFAMAVDVNILLANRSAFRSDAQRDSIVQWFADRARATPGIARVDHFTTMRRDTLTSEIARRWIHQFPYPSNVELVITLDSLSTWGGNIASHGSPRSYDSHVPLIFAGAGIVPSTRPEFVRTVDIGPTLAALLGIKVGERVDGVPLSVGSPPVGTSSAEQRR
ncbi:MAG: alkaline phosphatase family protein [Gemmatimonadaceae bacterium]|nr:alkaline phosphatase family protein [Gemmatimonadaceae bacterium]